MKMFTQESIKAILQSYQGKDGMPTKLITMTLDTMSSVQHTEELGITVILNVTDIPAAEREKLDNEANLFLNKIMPEGENVSVVLTAEQQSIHEPPAPIKQKREIQKLSLPNVKNIVAIASGKGGVGKSTVAMNLAVALAQGGLKIGLLDADILGPSQPHMLGINKRAELNENSQIIPMQIHGVKTMSIGYMLEDNKSVVVWRGPMVQRALMQMLQDVDWGELDFLLIDMPPGTGDIPLSASQYIPLSGAIIVSTPQDIALLDAMKGLEMFEKLSVKILGIVENMSMFTCPKCGENTELFGHGGAKEEAKKRNIEFLGEIPLALEIRQSSDSGKPVNKGVMNAFVNIANKLKTILS